jgi:hypothetical protein
MTENQKRWAKMLREEKKKLESILHPAPKFGDIEICHEHLRNGKIRFTAWKGDDPVRNSKQWVIPRQDILTRPEFYKLYEKDILWLSLP